MNRHHFDPGPSGIETHCQARVNRPGTSHSTGCGHPLVSPYHFLPEDGCFGCLTGYDIGLPSSLVAYAHPECPVHGEPPPPLSPEQEEVIAAEGHCWCGGEVGLRVPGDEDGLGCLNDINHDWQGRASEHYGDKVDAMRLLYGTWPATAHECAYNPGKSCHEIMTKGSGHCCHEYTQPKDQP